MFFSIFNLPCYPLLSNKGLIIKCKPIPLPSGILVSLSTPSQSDYCISLSSQ